MVDVLIDGWWLKTTSALPFHTRFFYEEPVSKKPVRAS